MRATCDFAAPFHANYTQSSHRTAQRHLEGWTSKEFRAGQFATKLISHLKSNTMSTCSQVLRPDRIIAFLISHDSIIGGDPILEGDLLK